MVALLYMSLFFVPESNMHLEIQLKNGPRIMCVTQYSSGWLDEISKRVQVSSLQPVQPLCKKCRPLALLTNEVAYDDQLRPQTDSVGPRGSVQDAPSDPQCQPQSRLPALRLASRE